MQIRTASTAGEIQEAISLSRPKNFLFKFIAANWYATLIGVLVVAADVNQMAHGRTPRWDLTALLLAVCGALMGYSWFRWNAKVSNALRASTARIESLSLDGDGVRVLLRTGTSTFIPWSSYTKWVEGKVVFVLTGKDGGAILAIDDGNRDTVRGLLSSHIR
jgi:hypothetical protein